MGCKLYIREVRNDKECILLIFGGILLVFIYYIIIGYIEYKSSCLKMFLLIRFFKFLDCLLIFVSDFFVVEGILVYCICIVCGCVIDVIFLYIFIE